MSKDNFTKADFLMQEIKDLLEDEGLKFNPEHPLDGDRTIFGTISYDKDIKKCYHPSKQLEKIIMDVICRNYDSETERKESVDFLEKYNDVTIFINNYIRKENINKQTKKRKALLSEYIGMDWDDFVIAYKKIKNHSEYVRCSYLDKNLINHDARLVQSLERHKALCLDLDISGEYLISWASE